MKIHYRPQDINNFHNQVGVPVNVKKDRYREDLLGNGPGFIISRPVAMRLRSHFCGVKDCKCPAGGILQLNEAGTEFGLLLAHAE